jgi:nitrogen regulatory protein P-II 1
MLRLVTAIIKPHRLGDVLDALRAAGVIGMTVTEVRGFGRQGGHTETYRGAEYKVDFIPKVKVEVLAAEDAVAGIVSTITAAAQSGQIGDGKIWVTPVDQAVRVRTGEEGTDAV